MHAGTLNYEDKLIQNMFRNRVLADFIYANIDNDRKNWHHIFSDLELDLKYPAIALLEPAGCKEEDFKKRTNFEQLREFLERNLGGDSIIFTTNDGLIGLLFSWLSREIVGNTKRLINANIAFEVSIGVGKPCKQLLELQNSYRQAAAALKDKFYRGKGAIIHYNDIKPYASSYDYPFVMENEFYECIKSAGRMDEVESIVDGFYRLIMQEGPVEIQAVYEATIRLLVGLEKKVLSELGNENVFKCYPIISVTRLETLQEIKSRVIQYIFEMHGRLEQKDTENHRSIIKRTLQYMEQECRHASLHSVAQKVYMTPTYLSMLFKLNTGTTFIDKLTDIRIDKAKHMLKNTLLKNYEVAEMVGYQDSRYFSQIFKKKVGLTPSEYRESAG